MIRARSTPFALFVGAIPFVWCSSALFGAAGPAQAAPAAASPRFAPRATGVAPMTFSVTARITATGVNTGPAQTIRAQVALNGPQARIQTQVGSQPVVVLYAPPYVYRILPLSKAGVRWKLTGTKGSMAMFDPQQLLRDPTQIRSTLLAGGAKKTGSADLKGVPAEIYEIKAPVTAGGPRVQGVKVWLRRADALPLRLEANGPGVKVVATWSSYSRPKRLSPALFTLPASYKIRDVRSAPPFSGL